jgi:hypothetical protein
MILIARHFRSRRLSSRLFPMLTLVNQKRPGIAEIGRNTEPRRIGQCEAAVDEGREGFGKHSLERILHGVMLK